MFKRKKSKTARAAAKWTAIIAAVKTAPKAAWIGLAGGAAGAGAVLARRHRSQTPNAV